MSSVVHILVQFRCIWQLSEFHELIPFNNTNYCYLIEVTFEKHYRNLYQNQNIYGLWSLSRLLMPVTYICTK